ncbi:MAG: STAS/SEC14 domain-containing protein [Hydrogenophilaceae bacterium]|nr:STAS/SEC14 domain-containing protein [Hydrogenophilaceae bacterium]
MISVNVRDNVISMTVMGQFTLDDYKEFEEAVLYGIKFQGVVNLLIDLRDMLSFSLDVAWEEIRFSRQHANDFNRVAILTSNEWIAWSTWVNRLFVNADIQLFDDLSEAEAWVRQTASEPLAE